MKKTCLIAGFLAFGVFGSAAFAADPALLNLVMPDAKVLGGVNVTTAKISPLGQFLIGKAQMQNQGIQQFVAATGFNPLMDVTEVLGATAGDPAKPGGLLLMRGTFKVDQVVAAIQSANKAGVQVQTHAGATLVTFPAGKSKAKTATALAFIGSDIAVAGDSPTVIAALDRASAANSLDPALAVQINTLSGADDAWILSVAPLSSLIPTGAAGKGMPAQATQILANITAFSGTVKLDQNVTVALNATATDAKTAEALGNVVKLLVSFAAMSSGKDPQMTQALALLQNLQVTTSGTDLNLSLAIPESTIEQFINTIPASAKAHSGN
jgi:hypothetical protein